MNKNKIIHQEHFHIDNGGFDFSVDEYGNITIEFGFFGYSNTVINLTSTKDFGCKQLKEFFGHAELELKLKNHENSL